MCTYLINFHEKPAKETLIKTVLIEIKSYKQSRKLKLQFHK